jgi:5-formyltetrahydrofolate cyclo-ligase
MPTAHDVAPSTRTAPLHEAKQRVRQHVLALRAALSPAVRAEAEAAIARRIVALPSFVRARNVLLTMPFRGEWDTRPLFAAALAAGKRVVLPRVDTATRMLALHAVTHVSDDVAAGYGGIAEPHAHLPLLQPADIDWVLVPGIAFDLAGRRLGYGGGFYDRLLPMLATGSRHVAGAFDEQVVDAVPTAPHDITVHQLVSPTRILDF